MYKHTKRCRDKQKKYRDRDHYILAIDWIESVRETARYDMESDQERKGTEDTRERNRQNLQSPKALPDLASRFSLSKQVYN